MEKTIVVGVGGTGLETIRALRRRVVEAYGRLDALPHLGFFYLDTDPKETIVNEDNRKRWEVLGVSTQLAPEEYFMIEAPPIGPIVRNIESYPQIKEWFPVEELQSIDQAAKDTPGARQIRPLGRFALTLKADEIAARFTALYNRLPQAPGGGKTKVYIVCSLSGGTGGGMFVDLAYRLQEWSGQGCITVAFLVFPDLTAGRGPRYLVNAYASLLELNYLDVGQAPDGGELRPVRFKLPGRDRPVKTGPFDFCYLVSPRNEAGVEVGLNETLPDMIAHRIFLNFDSSFAADAASLLQNGGDARVERLTDPFTQNQHSQNFFTFGLSSVQYPVKPITEIIAYRVAADALSSWLKSREIPGDVNARVEAYLPELHLTADYLLGNKDFFGGRADFESYDREIENFINEIKRTIPPHKIVPFIGDKQRQFLEGFRSVGLIKFYQDKRNDLDGAVQEVVRLLTSRLGAILTDPQLGYEFADKALDQMLRVLVAKHQEYVSSFNGLPAKEKGSRGSLTGFQNELTTAESRMVFREKAIKEALNKVSDALKINLSATIGIRAYEFGLSLLARVLEQIQALRERLIDWRNGIERMAHELTSESHRRRDHLLEKQRNIKEFNGVLLLSADSVEGLYRSIDITSALRHVQDQVVPAAGEGNLLELPFHAESVADRLYQAALDWIKADNSLRLTEKNVADKIFDEYPDPARRRAKLGEVYSKSKPFLVFDDGQKQIWAGRDKVGYTYSPTTRAGLAALLDDENGGLKPVAKLKEELRSATELSPSSIKKISDRHQILFLQEITAFPLRLIRDVAILKEYYDEYKKKPEATPVHLQKRFEPPLMDLFLTTPEESRALEQAEEAFLIGWVDGRLRREMNRREGQEEVRYRFVEFGSDTFVRLGNDWDDAFKFCVSESETARPVRQRLVSEIARYLKTLDTPVKRRELSVKLSDHLDGLKGELELGEESPSYQCFDRIRKRVIEKHRLPFDVAAAAARPSRSAEPSRPGTSEHADDFRQRFLTLVRTALRNGKGSLTPAMINMLRASQGRYALTDEESHALIQQAMSELAESPAALEYRNTFEAFVEDGEISEDERAILIERQVELALNDVEVADIEKSVLRKRGTAV